MPLLSIMIPTHNRATFFRRAMRTLDPLAGDERIEVVIANSSSVDYPYGYRRSWHVSEPDVSREQNYMNGLRACHGAYVLIYEDDDIIVIDTLKAWLDSVSKGSWSDVGMHIFRLCDFNNEVSSAPPYVQSSTAFIINFPKMARRFQWGQVITRTDYILRAAEIWWERHKALHIMQSDVAISLIVASAFNAKVCFHDLDLLYVGIHDNNYSWGNNRERRENAKRCVELLSRYVYDDAEWAKTMQEELS